MDTTSRPIEIGLSEKDREGVVRILTVLLADEYLLYTKTRNFHWNVTGPSFMEFHKLFESQYETLDEIVDSTAERIRSLGHNAIGTLKEMLDNARLKEMPATYPNDLSMVAELLDGHEHLITSLRADLETTQNKYHDAGTTDFLTGLMEAHEKTAWMLRSYLA